MLYGDAQTGPRTEDIVTVDLAALGEFPADLSVLDRCGVLVWDIDVVDEPEESNVDTELVEWEAKHGPIANAFDLNSSSRLPAFPRGHVSARPANLASTGWRIADFSAPKPPSDPPSLASLL